jgi:hypothetical protein
MIKPQGVILQLRTLVLVTSVLLLAYYTFNSVPPDPTMTMDNVSQLLNKIPGDKWEKVMGEIDGLNIPLPLLEEIQRRYSTDTEKNHACADYYVNYHPEAEWTHLTAILYFTYTEYALARESKSFMLTGKNTTTTY